MTLAERFARSNGIHWHRGSIYQAEDGSRRFGCAECGSVLPNPTFSHPEEVLEVMMGRSDWFDFLPEIGSYVDDKYMGKVNQEIYVEYIIEKDKLLYVAVEWCDRHKL